MSVSAHAIFLVSAILAVAGALGTVLSHKPLRAAMALLLHIIALAGLYLTLHAQLLAAIQLLVYAGAVVVLFVFVIMLIGPDAEARHDARGLTTRAISGVLMGMVTIAVTFTIHEYDPELGRVRACEPEIGQCVQFGGVEGVGAAIYQGALVPFELVSITLLVAIIGALAIARGRTPAEAAATRKLRAEREAAKQARTEEERRLAAEVAAHGGH